ncbi:multidrug effflux MFS transporter [Streptomyces acidiscabies]|uniref:Multidrug effflux MFS transporter n=1 Tax=Streptomyces acidiscabies TaxID=42234 RepID=A0AAP6EHJ9_9ACTN|nr:multidrug effflux MFS transporter [Streptomyces acidiscabies]MBP5941806.1 multidrug effflux MFS transporter [Streptomyces sp. LBUM 1476]MBZ3913232.1 multidrug effflux MFS transporter [Streptomyces acidiscabies]MDX2962928.1 multidrug effflux MFS transporter [Streptomyces acidiscabies]MDX3021439.1 multidrug effflux MFS transporter [Streptomyces acidiscabies]MDX3790197.1 multidrug effflux MFS transporter [Streptomyces acidiscabies]
MSSPPRPAALLAATLALLSFGMPLATDMYLPAFPKMADDLGTDASGVQLTLTAFLLGQAAGQLVFGPLSDRHGRRRPILVGAAVCALATALCALSPNLATLIALRFVTGFSGAAGLVVGRAVVSDVATGAVAAKLFGVLIALGGIAPIVAPLAGGAVVTHAGGWRGVFWVLAAITLLMMLAALFFIPESLPAERRRAGGVAATLQTARSVLADRVYVGYTLAFVFACGALFSYISGSAFLLQNVLGFTVGQASVAFSLGALTATLSSTANTRLVGHYPPRLLLKIGLFTMFAASAVALVVTLAGHLDRVLALGLIAVTFLGLGQVFGTATALAIERVPYAAGTGSAVLGTLQGVLGAVAAPLIGLGGDDTAVPLFTGMTGCCLVALFALLLTRDAGEPRPDTLPGHLTISAERR